MVSIIDLFNALFSVVYHLVAPYKQFLDEFGHVNGHPSHRIVEQVDVLVPRANRNASTPAAKPLLFIGSLKKKTPICPDPPFGVARVMEDVLWRLFRGRTVGNSIGRAVNGAMLAVHAEIVGIERDGLVSIQGHVGGHRFQSHIDAKLRREHASVSGKFTNARIYGQGHHKEFRSGHAPGFSERSVVADSPNKIGQLCGDHLEPGVGV